jgi:hypothetical protein
MIKRGDREAKVKVQLFEVQNLQLAMQDLKRLAVIQLLLPTVI